MMIAAGGNEGRLSTEPLRQLEAEHVAIECKRAINIGDLQMHMPDAGARRDRRCIGRNSRFRGHDASPSPCGVTFIS
jgi:hypothetical protein